MTYVTIMAAIGNVNIADFLRMKIKSENLWGLRQQVNIESNSVCDFKNDLGINEFVVHDFFRGYVKYIESLAEESGLWDEVCLGIQDEIKYGLLVGCNTIEILQAQLEFYRVLMYNRFDNEEILLEFYNCCLEDKRQPSLK